MANMLNVGGFVKVPYDFGISSSRPLVIMVVGVNGTGKTLSIAKLAGRFTTQGKKVILAAADTFRAAAIDQLQLLGQRVGADVIYQKPGATPAQWCSIVWKQRRLASRT
jgi:fused signal recognition particle receptor